MVLSDRRARILRIIALSLFILFVFFVIVIAVLDVDKDHADSTFDWIMAFFVGEMVILVATATRRPFLGLFTGLLMILLLLMLAGAPARNTKALALTVIAFLLSGGWRSIWNGVLNKFRVGITRLKLKIAPHSSAYNMWRVTTQFTPNIDVDEILNRLELNKDLTVIPLTMWLLVRNDGDMKARVAKSLYNLTRILPVNGLLHIDSICRDRTSLNWSFDWSRANPNDLVIPSMCVEEKLAVFGIASFHPNGYLREKAVDALSLSFSGQELPFLLIRLNDWVLPVRERAIRAVSERLYPANAANIIDSLPLVAHLRKCSRGDHHEIIQIALSVISQAECRPALERGLSSPDDKVRALCYETMTETGRFGARYILQHLIRETLPHVRLSILSRLGPALTSDIVEEFGGVLMGDRYGPIRALALEMLYQHYSSKIIPQLLRSALDDHGKVREVARFFLKKQCYQDLSDLYRNALREGISSQGVITGLGEVGTAPDTESILPFLNSNRVKLVRAAIRALHRLDPERFTRCFVELLADARPGVSKEALLALLKDTNVFDDHNIYVIYSEANLSHVRGNAARLLCSLSKWRSLPYILEVCQCVDDDIVRLGREALVRWIGGFNKLMAAPTREQATAIERALGEYGSAIGEHERNWILFCLKPHKSETPNS